jgi:hypothetical protein
MLLLQEGRIIRDTYEVERFLGEGAFGQVYRVKHRFLGRQAMKIFKKAARARSICHGSEASRFGLRWPIRPAYGRIAPHTSKWRWNGRDFQSN